MIRSKCYVSVLGTRATVSEFLCCDLQIEKVLLALFIDDRKELITVDHLFRETAAKIHNGNNRLRLEDDAVVIHTGCCWLQLLGEERHVIGQAEVVLLVC